MSLIIFLLFLTINALKIQNDQTLIFNQSPLSVNNIKFRESINPVYFLYFKKGDYNISYYPISSINSKPHYGKYPLTDITLNNSWKIIDYLYYFQPSDGYIQILASTFLHQNASFRIRQNSKILFYHQGKKLNYFNKLWIKKGNINLFLEGRSNNKIYFNPSSKNGFYNSYQLGLWGNNIKSTQNESSKLNYQIYINDRLIHFEYLSN